MGDDVKNIVKDLSGGEKVKAALCKVLLSDNNFLILDEPNNYLDIKALEALENRLTEIISLLFIEKDEDKKLELDKEYNNILKLVNEHKKL